MKFEQLTLFIRWIRFHIQRIIRARISIAEFYLNIC